MSEKESSGVDHVALTRSLIESWRMDAGPWEAFVGRHASKSMMVYGLTTHTYNLADSALLLHEAGHHIQMLPLVRQAIECATTAAWLTLYDDAGLSFVHAGLRQRQNAFEGLAKAGFRVKPEDVEEIEESLASLAIEKTDPARYFEKRCEELKGGVHVYAVYRVASGLSHASTALCDQYLRAVPKTANEPLGVAFAQSPELDTADAWLGTLTSMVITAGLAWDRIEKHHRHRSELRAAARLVGMSSRVEMSDRGFVQHEKQLKKLKAAERATGSLAQVDS